MEANLMVYGGGAAAEAAIANAIKASGAIIRVEPGEFQKILSRVDEPLVVRAEGGWRTKNYQYLTAYKGLIFHTKSQSELLLPSRVEMISADKIWIPDW
ncbi:hypothetical protein M1O14_00405 [Dehalococcoidia bacterium]|nr:hypothetical protein [Dehalococcoidia bacterium]